MIQITFLWYSFITMTSMCYSFWNFLTVLQSSFLICYINLVPFLPSDKNWWTFLFSWISWHTSQPNIKILDHWQNSILSWRDSQLWQGQEAVEHEHCHAQVAYLVMINMLDPVCHHHIDLLHNLTNICILRIVFLDCWPHKPWVV